ncbi:MAG: phosphoribosylglycinamide formyltransferase [Acidimicrobiaceae bacterium]|nr:phosphoribosylglycinamide formyltransferase [Acidimicrobiaceae bacterium]MXW61534.1 phosphoribosylglycinamide formyltransferase [Acidimicrobiaceae bacterium]MXW75546.1 phosphoribosylglycinamide formyltransferase [Acidimicrobiaceae bacterium]MYA73202.1 phosphoribosylglycinamide formyltransferase [Acidimicrobiaceae bacterium]MYC42178.1 phosphoribosylglycinamide formyltransferase [Acidimicrobiaceae bacterium]
MTPRIVVLASGAGSNLQALLDAVNNGDLNAEIVGVIVNRRDAYALERASTNEIPTSFLGLRPYLDTSDDPAQARRRYDADLAGIVSGHRPDLVVLAGWMHLLTMEFLSHFPGRVMNLHPALPGEFPGAHAIDDAWHAHLSDGLDRTGVMVHLVPDEGVDDGPVLATQVVPIRADDDRESLEARIHAAEHDLLVRTVGDFLERM